MEEDKLTQIWKEYSQIKQYLNGKDYYKQLEMKKADRKLKKDVMMIQ